MALVLGAAGAAGAHTPHDDIHDVVLSPGYAQDRTLFIIVRGNLMRSVDAGASWQRLVRGLDHRHRLVALGVADATTLFVASRGDGVYKSEDGGDSWFAVNRGLGTRNIERLLASRTPPWTVLAAGPGGNLYRSADGGSSWSLVLEAPEVTAMAFVPPDEDRVVAGDGEGSLYVSRDRGATWKASTTFEGSAGVTAVGTAGPIGSETAILVGTGNGEIFRQREGGDSFVEVHALAEPQPILSFAGAPGDTAVLASAAYEGTLCSNDAGVHWRTCTSGLTHHPQAKELGRPYFSTLEVSPAFDRDRTLFLAGYNGLFASEDAGRHWREIETLSPTSIVGLALSPDYAEDQTVVATTYMWGAYLSRDAGRSWRAINRGLAEVWRTNAISRVFDVVFSPSYADDATLFSSTWYRFLRSSDGGRSWEKVLPVDAPWWTSTHHGLTISVSPAFATDRTLYVGTTRGKVLVSRDGGRSFSVASELDRGISSLVISPDFPRDGTLFAGAPSSVYRTTDRGLRWKRSDRGFHLVEGLEDRAAAVRLAISPAYDRDGTVFASTAEGIYATRDSGENWERLPGRAYGGDSFIEGVAISPRYPEDRTVIASVRGWGLFKSTDGGESFEEIGRGLIEQNVALANMFDIPLAASVPLRFSPTYGEDATLYGFSGDDLFRSQDGGERWERIRVPAPDLASRARVIYHRLRVGARDLRRNPAGLVLVAAALGLLVAGMIAYGIWRARRHAA